MHRWRLHVEFLVDQGSADGLDDLVDRVGATIGNPIRLASCCRRKLRGDDAVDQVLDVDHRTTLFAVTDDRKPTGADQPEEGRLTRWLERAIEPRRANDRRVEP